MNKASFIDAKVFFLFSLTNKEKALKTLVLLRFAVVVSGSFSFRGLASKRTTARLSAGAPARRPGRTTHKAVRSCVNKSALERSCERCGAVKAGDPGGL